MSVSPLLELAVDGHVRDGDLARGGPLLVLGQLLLQPPDQSAVSTRSRDQLRCSDWSSVLT